MTAMVQKDLNHGLVMTIASDDEVELEPDDTASDSSETNSSAPAESRRSKKRQRSVSGRSTMRDAPLDPKFSFDADSSSLAVSGIEPARGWDFKSELLPRENNKTSCYSHDMRVQPQDI